MHFSDIRKDTIRLYGTASNHATAPAPRQSPRVRRGSRSVLCRHVGHAALHVASATRTREHGARQQAWRVFWSKRPLILVNPATHSGGIRPPNLVESGQVFWANPATVLADSGQGGGDVADVRDVGSSPSWYGHPSGTSTGATACHVTGSRCERFVMYSGSGWTRD